MKKKIRMIILLVLGLFLCFRIENVKANDKISNPYVIITNIPYSEDKTIYKSMSFNGDSAKLPITIHISYIKHLEGTKVTYSDFSVNTNYGYLNNIFSMKSKGNLKMNVNLTTKKITVTEEVDLVYNKGNYSNYVFDQYRYSVEFDIK